MTVRRTISAWETAPQDGTPFHILNTLRFNRFSGHFEVLFQTEEGRKWHALNLADNPPSMWLRLVPLPYEIPTSFAFTWTYEAKRLSWRERLMKRLFGRLLSISMSRYVWRSALASADTHPKGGDVKQAPSLMSGAVAKPDAPTMLSHTPSPSSRERK